VGETSFKEKVPIFLHSSLAFSISRRKAENCLYRFSYVSDYRLDVLDGTDKVLLNGNLPQSSPPCPVEAVTSASRIGPFHAMLSSSQIASGFRAFRDREHGVQIVLSGGTLHGAAAVVPGTPFFEFTDPAIFLLRHVLGGVPMTVVRPAGELLPGGTTISIGGGLVHK